MKTIKILSLAVATLALASCGASKKAQQNQYPYYGGYPPQGYYQQPYQPQQAPQGGYANDGFTEIQQSPIEIMAYQGGAKELRAYGSGESASEQLALNSARAQANAALQEKIEVYVRAGLDLYAQETGVNSEYGLDEMTRNQVITAAKGVINGSSIVGSRKLYNAETKRYKYEVCVAYDKAGVLSAMQAQSERIRQNEKQFEQDMQHAWDALDAQNNRVSLGEQQQMRQNEMQQQNLDRQHQRTMEYQQQQNNYNLESQRINAPYQTGR